MWELLFSQIDNQKQEWACEICCYVKKNSVISRTRDVNPMADWTPFGFRIEGCGYPDYSVRTKIHYKIAFSFKKFAENLNFWLVKIAGQGFLHFLVIFCHFLKWKEHNGTLKNHQKFQELEKNQLKTEKKPIGSIRIWNSGLII